MSLSGAERQEIDFVAARRALRRASALGYSWAMLLAAIATILSYLLLIKFGMLSLAPLMAGIVILACFSDLGPTLVCGILGSFGWIVFVALDLHQTGHARGLPWRFVDAPARFAQFAAMAVFISASYFARRRAERLLRNAQQRLAVVLDESQIGTWHYDVPAGVFWLSPRMDAILGLDAGAAPGYAAYLGNIPAPDRPAVIDAMASALERQANYEIEHRFVRADGSVRRIVMRGKPFVGRTGKVERIIGVGIDVSKDENVPVQSAVVAS
jgi:PAS domain-containing protein